MTRDEDLPELRRKTKIGSWRTADEVLLNGTEEHIVETAQIVFKKWAGAQQITNRKNK